MSDERPPEKSQAATEELRKWAVEQAVEFTRRKDTIGTPVHITTIATRLYIYVTTGKTY